jgi:hypothetical protein
MVDLGHGSTTKGRLARGAAETRLGPEARRMAAEGIAAATSWRSGLPNDTMRSSLVARWEGANASASVPMSRVVHTDSPLCRSLLIKVSIPVTPSTKRAHIQARSHSFRGNSAVQED